MSANRLSLIFAALTTLMLLPFVAQADCMNDWNYCMKKRCGPNAIYGANPKQTRCGANCPCCAEYQACLARPAPLPADQIATLRQNAATCEAGAAGLAANMYDYRENRDPKASFKAAYDSYAATAKKACADARAYVLANRSHPSLAAAVAAIDGYSRDPMHEIEAMGSRVLQYCPQAHLAQYNCVNVTAPLTAAVEALRKLTGAVSAL